MTVFLKVYGVNFFQLVSCVTILASMVCFSCFNSVFYNFHLLILCKQTSKIIIIKTDTAITQYIFIHKKCRGFFLKLNIFFSIWSSWWSCLRHVHKLSFACILIILLRPLSAHTLFNNGRFTKHGQKNKQEYISKPDGNACKAYPFHK